MITNEIEKSGNGTAPGGNWIEVLAVFLRLGLTSFGGPIAHLGYFRDELVVRRKWLDESAYADLVALCQFLPGPASSQIGFSLGLLRAGGLTGGGIDKPAKPPNPPRCSSVTYPNRPCDRSDLNPPTWTFVAIPFPTGNLLSTLPRRGLAALGPVSAARNALR